MMRSFIFAVLSLAAFLIPGVYAFRRGRAELGGQGAVAGRTFAAAFAAYTAVALAVFISSAMQLGVVDGYPTVVRRAGLAVALIGFAVYVAARRQMQSFRLTWGLDTSRLISTGIYSRSRHPQLLGWGMLLLGVTLYSGSGVALLFVAVFAAGSALWLPVEEAAMRARYGESYEQYHARTPVFPRIALAHWLRKVRGI